MSTFQNLVTADELLKMPEIEWRYELVKGKLRRYPFEGAEHGAVSMHFAVSLGLFVEESDLGVVVNANTGFQLACDPDTVRAPDVSFVRQERINEIGLGRRFWPGAPDLAVEVISPSDTYSEVEEKVGQWLDAGTRMVIVVDRRTRTVIVYSSPDKAVRLNDTGVIDCGDVVTGFSYPVADLFR